MGNVHNIVLLQVFCVYIHLRALRNRSVFNPEFSKRETTSQGIESIDLLPGDVFTWKENNTK